MTDIDDFNLKEFNVKDYINRNIELSDDYDTQDNSISSCITNLQIQSENIFNSVEALIEENNTHLPKILQEITMLQMKLSTVEPQITNLTNIYTNEHHPNQSHVLNTLINYNTIYTRLKNIQEKLICLLEWPQLVQLFVINKNNNVSNLYDGLLQMKKYIEILNNLPGNTDRQINYDECRTILINAIQSQLLGLINSNDIPQYRELSMYLKELNQIDIIFQQYTEYSVNILNSIQSTSYNEFLISLKEQFKNIFINCDLIFEPISISSSEIYQKIAESYLSSINITHSNTVKSDFDICINSILEILGPLNKSNKYSLLFYKMFSSFQPVTFAIYKDIINNELVILSNNHQNIIKNWLTNFSNKSFVLIDDFNIIINDLSNIFGAYLSLIDEQFTYFIGIYINVLLNVISNHISSQSKHLISFVDVCRNAYFQSQYDLNSIVPVIFQVHQYYDQSTDYINNLTTKISNYTNQYKESYVNYKSHDQWNCYLLTHNFKQFQSVFEFFSTNQVNLFKATIEELNNRKSTIIKLFFDYILINCDKLLKDLPKLEVWNSSDIIEESLVVPTNTISSIGEMLLSLNDIISDIKLHKITNNFYINIFNDLWRELQIILDSQFLFIPRIEISSDVEEIDSAIYWLQFISQVCFGYYLKSVLSMISIKNSGLHQLLSDLNYFRNALLALGLDITQLFDVLSSIVNIPKEKYHESSPSDVNSLDYFIYKRFGKMRQIK